jgi:hypothetical protein
MPRMRRLIPLLLVACAGPAQEDETQAIAEKECAALTERLEAYLGPKLEKPVPVEMVSSLFIADFAVELESKMLPGGLLEIAGRLSERLHQIPPGYDLVKQEHELLKRGVAGLYDPIRKRLYVVQGRGPGTSLFRSTAAHELVHAYRDVDKDYWGRIVAAIAQEEDTDWGVAVSCLAEGDATLLGAALAAPQDLANLLPGMAARAESSARQMREASAGNLQEFPPALREFFLDRYSIGMVFAAHLYLDGGAKALSAAYDQPPRSTEQVMHPEKYLTRRPDEPTVFRGGDPTGALGEGWSLALANVMGEFEVRVHFSESLGRKRAAAAAVGWDGMRYHFCEKKGAPAFFGAVSTWDSEDDAQEFAAAWADWAAGRDGGSRETRESGETHLIETDEGLVAVRRHGRDVLIADGVPPDRVEATLAALAAATRSERRADARPGQR